MSETINKLQEIAQAKGYRFSTRELKPPQPPLISQKKIRAIQNRISGKKRFKVYVEATQYVTEIYIVEAPNKDMALELYHDGNAECWDTEFHDSEYGDIEIEEEK